MFLRSKRGQRGPQMLPIRDLDEPIRLDEARHAAWEFAIGLERQYEPVPRRSHRGTLPDVDYARAVPVPRRPGLIARLFRLFAGGPHGERATARESGTGEAALGEAERKAYVWVLDWESHAAGQAKPAGADNRIRAA